ncbi:MAG: class I SAM-dependent rRNA methyltransferase [Planctomycetota bacterium]
MPAPVEPTSLPSDVRSPWVLLRSVSPHPFVYRKMLRQVDPAARPGDVVNLYDKGNRFFGQGLYNPRSQICVRLLSRDAAPLDDAFWRGRLEQAVSLRRQLRLDQVTDAYRLVHAEGDDLSGLIVERYADCLVFEFFALGMFQRRERLAELIGELLGRPTTLDRPEAASATWRVFWRADARIEQIEGFHLPGGPREWETAAPRVIVREHGVRYRVDVKHGHKTGFFCDQRENRRRLAAYCRDASVLDLCCYTGGFSLAARTLGGARDVIGVDLDEAAVALAHENANLNQVRVDFVHADAFSFVRQLLVNRRTFDVVVLDPPKLAAYRAELDEALHKYHDLNHLALQAVRPGGLLLTCSCSGLVSPPAFLDVVCRAAQRAGRALQLLDQSGAAPDHPILPRCPESSYLKALWFRVL